MLKFYIVIWFYWVLRMLFVTLFTTISIAVIITFVLYIKQGIPSLSFEILNALFKIFEFWFLLAINFAIPLALFISVKYLFNRCVNGFSFKLLSCPKDAQNEIITEIVYGDLVQVWRKMFFLVIWNSAILMILALIVMYFVREQHTLFSWFSIYLLYLFILLSGYPSIVLLNNRCKRVRIMAC